MACPRRDYLKLRPKQGKLLLILASKKNFWNLTSNEAREAISLEHLGSHKTSKYIKHLKKIVKVHISYHVSKK